MTETITMLDAALDYAKRGFKVFPIECGGKKPLIGTRDGGKGVHDATRDTDQIKTWWTRFPDANIGVHAEGFWVLDIDGERGKASFAQLVATYGACPVTLSQTSGSGGRHLLFRTPLGTSVKNSAGFYPGLDTRSYGGYIVVAPSLHPSGSRYAWDDAEQEIADTPEWLLALVKSDRTLGYKQGERSDSGSRDVDDASLAGYLFNGGLSEEQVYDVLAKRNNNPDFRDVALPDSEIWKTVRSIGRRDIRLPSQLRQAVADRLELKQTEANAVVQPDPNWIDFLIRSKTMIPKACIANAELAFLNSPVFAGAFAFNEMSAEVFLTRDIIDPINEKIMFNLVEGTVIDETAIQSITVICQRLVTEVTFTEILVAGAINLVSRKHKFHPVQDYLHGLKWDGVPRVGTWLVDLLGVEDDEHGYARAVGKKWLIAAVARAINPGCQSSSMLILEGQQDIGKSKAIKALAGENFFRDTPIDFGSKDRFGSIRGCWVYEFAEFDQFKAHDVPRIKSFMSSTHDYYRPPYAKSEVKQARNLVFIGTTNTDQYLMDTSGNKRYWPVKSLCTIDNPIDCARIYTLRDMIWAEAVNCFYRGEKSYIDEVGLARIQNAQAFNRLDLDDPWENDIQDYVKSHIADLRIQSSDILLHACGLQLARQGNRELARLKTVLAKLGWRYCNVRVNGKQFKTWRPDENFKKTLL